MSNARTGSARSGLDTGLWATQVLLALTFAGTGIWKLITPIRHLAEMIPWAGQVSPGLLYATAVFDLLGGLGILLRRKALLVLRKRRSALTGRHAGPTMQAWSMTRRPT
jgi:hypothetical protein